jgi:hypothetical protein
MSVLRTVATLFVALTFPTAVAADSVTRALTREEAEQLIADTQDAYIAAIRCGNRRFTQSSSERITKYLMDAAKPHLTEAQVVTAIRKERTIMNAVITNFGCSDPWVDIALNYFRSAVYPKIIKANAIPRA